MEIEDLEETEKKNSIVTPRCEKMLNDAMEYYMEKDLPEQAIKLATRFKLLVKIIEIMPGIGTPWKNGIRTAIIKKYRYKVYYRENKTTIDILGIWHTSRGTEFEES